MNLKAFLCFLLVVFMRPVVTLAADKNKDDSKSATKQLNALEKSSKDAAKDANAGKLESAKEKAGRGFDTRQDNPPPVDLRGKIGTGLHEFRDIFIPY